MQKEMDSIKFESRIEVAQITEALEEYKEMKGDKAPQIVSEMIETLLSIYTTW